MNDTGVEFIGEENEVGRIAIIPSKPTGITAFLITSKVAKNARQAEAILIGVIVLALLGIAAVFVFSSGILPRDTSLPLHEVYFGK